MTGEMGAFDFELALALGRTIDELSAMPTREYIAWRAYFTCRAALAETAPRRPTGG
jgi:hypothetical protein